MLLLLAVAWGLTPDFLLHGYTDYAQFKLRPLTLFELHLQTPLPPKLAVLLYLPPGQHALSLRVMDLGSQVLCHSQIQHFAYCLVQPHSSRLTIQAVVQGMCGCPKDDLNCRAICKEETLAVLRIEPYQITHFTGSLQLKESTELRADIVHTVITQQASVLMVEQDYQTRLSCLLFGVGKPNYIGVPLPVQTQRFLGLKGDIYLLVLHSGAVRLKVQKYTLDRGFHRLQIFPGRVTVPLRLEGQLSLSLSARRGSGVVKLQCEGLSLSLQSQAKVMASIDFMQQCSKANLVVQVQNNTLAVDLFLGMGEHWDGRGQALLAGNVILAINSEVTVELSVSPVKGLAEVCPVEQGSCATRFGLSARETLTLQNKCPGVEVCVSSVQGNGAALLRDDGYLLLASGLSFNMSQALVYELLLGEIEIIETNGSAIIVALAESHLYASQTANFTYSAGQGLKTFVIAGEKAELQIKGEFGLIRLRTDESICLDSISMEANSSCAFHKEILLPGGTERKLHLAVTKPTRLTLQSLDFIPLKLNSTFATECSYCVHTVLLQYSNGDRMSVGGDGYVTINGARQKDKSQIMYCGAQVCRAVFELSVSNTSSPADSHLTFIALTPQIILPLFRNSYDIVFTGEPLRFFTVAKGDALLQLQGSHFIPQLLVNTGTSGFIDQTLFPTEEQYLLKGKGDQFSTLDYVHLHCVKICTIMATATLLPGTPRSPGVLTVSAASKLFEFGQGQLWSGRGLTGFLFRKANNNYYLLVHSSQDPMIAVQTQSLLGLIFRSNCVFSTFQTTAKLLPDKPTVVSSQSNFLVRGSAGLFLQSDNKIKVAYKLQLQSNAEFINIQPEGMQFNLGICAQCSFLLRVTPEAGPAILLLRRTVIRAAKDITYRFRCNDGQSYFFSYFASDAIRVISPNPYSLSTICSGYKENSIGKGKTAAFPRRYDMFVAEVLCQDQQLNVSIGGIGQSIETPLVPGVAAIGKLYGPNDVACFRFNSFSSAEFFKFNLVKIGQNQSMDLALRQNVATSSTSRSIFARQLRNDNLSQSFLIAQVPGVYTICLANRALSPVQFLAQIDSNELSLLAPGYPVLVKTKANESRYFFMVLEGNKTYQLRLEYCSGKATIAGALSQVDLQLGVNVLNTTQHDQGLQSSILVERRAYFYVKAKTDEDKVVRLVLVDPLFRSNLVGPANATVALKREKSGLTLHFISASCDGCSEVLYESVVSSSNESLAGYLKCQLPDNNLYFVVKRGVARIGHETEQLFLEKADLPDNFGVGLLVYSSDGTVGQYYSTQYVYGYHQQDREQKVLEMLLLMGLFGGVVVLAAVLRVCKARGVLCFRSQAPPPAAAEVELNEVQEGQPAQAQGNYQNLIEQPNSE